MEEKKNLNNFMIGRVPTLMYIPDFITDSEEIQLLNNIYKAPVSQWKSLKSRRLQNWGGVVHEKGLLPQDLPSWLKTITLRIYEESGLFPSMINHVLINEYLPNQGIMPHQDGPAYFPVVAILSLGSPAVMDFSPHSRLKSCTDSRGNNVEDTCSAGRESEMTDNLINDHHPFSVLLMPRSLLIFKDAAYSDYLHGIRDDEVQQCDGAVNEIEALKHQRLNESSSDTTVIRTGDPNSIHRTTNRVSLTCRLVLKVHKNLFKF